MYSAPCSACVTLIQACMKKYGLSQEELEKTRNKIVSSFNALGTTVEDRLETLESIKKYLSQEEFEQKKNEILSSN